MELSQIQIEENISLTSQGRPVAFVEQPALNETQLVLARALALLGPNGEWWLPGTDASSGCHVCTMMALARSIKGRRAPYSAWIGHAAAHFINQAAHEMEFTRDRYPRAVMHGYPATLMNEVAKSFAVIKSAYERAIILAGQ